MRVVLTGDLVLDEPDAAHFLAGIAGTMRAADLTIGHLEVPHTRSTTTLAGDVPAPGAPPENLAALAAAGVRMVSLAGNHIADCGAAGIADTISELQRCGIAHAGAGADLVEARRPAFARIGRRRIALLSYNCVGPEAGWAGPSRAGSAYLPLVTADGGPVTPRADITDVPPQAVEILSEDISAARGAADCVIVALHKGIVHTPARLAAYERQLSHSAIELGADAVAGHHAHILRGIEFHRGRPIFHGLGNGCVVTRALDPGQDNPARRDWARKRKEMFGFEPDPAYPLAPFHPEAVNAMFGVLELSPDGGIAAAMVPVWIEPPGRPTLANPPRARAIRDYVIAISKAAGLPPIAIDDDGAVKVAAA